MQAREAAQARSVRTQRRLRVKESGAKQDRAIHFRAAFQAIASHELSLWNCSISQLDRQRRPTPVFPASSAAVFSAVLAKLRLAAGQTVVRSRALSLRRGARERQCAMAFVWPPIASTSRLKRQISDDGVEEMPVKRAKHAFDLQGLELALVPHKAVVPKAADEDMKDEDKSEDRFSINSAFVNARNHDPIPITLTSPEAGALVIYKPLLPEATIEELSSDETSEESVKPKRKRRNADEVVQPDDPTSPRKSSITVEELPAPISSSSESDDAMEID